MKTSWLDRLSLPLSVVALAIASLLYFAGRREAPARATQTDRRAAPEEAARLTALVADVEALRGELAALRESVERRAQSTLLAAQVPATEYRQPVEPLPAPDEERAADAPQEFELRRALLERFPELQGDDRQDAMGELAELARWGDEQAKELLVSCLQDESAGVRLRALKELGRLDEANLSTYLRGAIADPSHKVRAHVADRLRKLPVEESGPLLVGLLRDPDDDVVAEAIDSLAGLKYDAARPGLVAQLDSESLGIATRAAHALVKLGDEGAASGTIERILDHFARGDVSQRVDDVKRLRRLKATDQLERILASDQSLAVREEARAALASMED